MLKKHQGSSRPLGWFSASVMVVASMIGTGVFTTSGFLLGDLGSPRLVLAAWMIGGVIATMGAVCYGALGRRIPESGGEYVFLSRTLHPAAGWMAGWLSVLVGFSAPLAMAAHAFGEYTAVWWPTMEPRQTGTWLLILFTALHAWHVKRGAHVQNWMVVLKVLALLVFTGLGLSKLPDLAKTVSESSPFHLGSFCVALVWISYSYAGWNAAVYLGGEIDQPSKNLPRSMILGTVTVALLYTALNAVFVYSAPVARLADQVEIGQLAAEALGGRTWSTAVTILVSAALITTVSSMTMIGPRVSARMAEDGYLPAWLARVEFPPRRAIYFQSTLALVLLWTLTFESLLTYIGFTLSISTAAAVVGLMRLRSREGVALPVPGWPWLPATFIVCVVGTTAGMISLQPKESALGLATLGIGWVAWFWGRKHGTT